MPPTEAFRFLPLLALLTLIQACASFQSPSVEVFNFDYTWSPPRPVANDSVLFQATAQQSDSARWGLTEESFRWYQQLPGSGFHLRHVGRTYTRNASETYFEGRYRLRVLVERKRQQQPARQAEQQQAWEGDLLVDVVKYVGLQKQVDIALLTNTTGNGTDRFLICRFWGWPLIDSLQFLAAHGSLCDRQHFETAEAEPHIDLVIRCPRLLPGTYSCGGRNLVSASQLTCELSGPDLTVASCYRPSLVDEPETAAAKDASSATLPGGARSSQPKAVSSGGAVMRDSPARARSLPGLVVALTASAQLMVAAFA